MGSNQPPRVMTPPTIWRWACVSGYKSPMEGVVSVSRLGVVRQPCGLSGGWKKTKPRVAPSHGRAVSNSADIFWGGKKMQVRGIINCLPYPARPLGMMLYGDFGALEEKQVKNYLYKQAMLKIREHYPRMVKVRPQKLAKVFPLIHCALCQYMEAISPCLDGGSPGSFDAHPPSVRDVLKAQGVSIEIHQWSRDWGGIWRILIEEIKTIDRSIHDALQPWIDQQNRVCFDKINRPITDWSES